jgi:hypothetical protein
VTEGKAFKSGLLRAVAATRTPSEPESTITWSMIWQFVVEPGAQILMLV